MEFLLLGLCGLFLFICVFILFFACRFTMREDDARDIAITNTNLIVDMSKKIEQLQAELKELKNIVYANKK